MLVYESGQFFWNWDIQVVGLDVDPVALEKARKAVYFHNSFRTMSPTLVEKHFVKVGQNGSQVKETIRRLVRLRQGNILEAASYEGLAPLDTIFCRNVLIYFSDATIQRAVRLFHDILAPGGYLLLGHAESLSRITDIFTPIRFPGAMIYQKPGGEAL
jgi:chemotaxis protein methyltransferase CheR